MKRLVIDINKSFNLSLLIFTLILLTFANTNAQNAYVDSLMRAGNTAYIAKNYEKAIDFYEKIVNEGYESSTLYYNLGNAYYKVGALGKAILNYERALELDPSNEDARYNLKIANAHIIDKINPVPKFFLAEWWERLLDAFSIKTLAIVTAVLFAALLIFVYFFFYGSTPATRKTSFTLGSISLAFLVLFVFLYIGKAKQITGENYGIVLAKEVTVRVSPDENANAAFVVHEGTKVLLVDKVGEWGNVKLADGKKGWAPLSTFELISK
jgi:tetratricopeptide (TPR) repeat protein